VAFGRLPEGRYLARAVAAGADKAPCTAAFDVRGNLAERLEVKAQPNLMKAIAERSGGAVLDEVDPSVLAEPFDRYLDQSRPQRLARSIAWDRAWVLLAAVGLWGAAWGLRRWSGLV
jgi:hypothetical protein